MKHAESKSKTEACVCLCVCVCSESMWGLRYFIHARLLVNGQKLSVGGTNKTDNTSGF